MRFLLVALALGFTLGMAHASTAPPDDLRFLSLANASTIPIAMHATASPMPTDATLRLCGEVEHARLMVFMSCPSGTELSSDEAVPNSDSFSSPLTTYANRYRATRIPMKAGHACAVRSSTTVLNC